jgi:hypothetical protein
MVLSTKKEEITMAKKRKGMIWLLAAASVGGWLILRKKSEKAKEEVATAVLQAAETQEAQETAQAQGDYIAVNGW